MKINDLKILGKLSKPSKPPKSAFETASLIYKKSMGWLLLGFLLYALVVLAEHALVAVSPHDQEQLRPAAKPDAQRALSLSNQIRPALAALLLARLLLKIVVAVCGAYWFQGNPMIRSSFYDFSIRYGLPGWLLWGSAGIILVFVLALLFRWVKILVSKAGILRSPLPWLIRLTPFILFWKALFSVFIRPEKSAQELADLNAASNPTVAEAQAAAGEKRELELLKSIVQFGDTTVKQVMQPRSKVISVDFRNDFHDVLTTVRESEFSRLPVYMEDLDNVTGILYVKDLVPHLDKPEGFEWQSLIRTNVLQAPESKRCSELLQEFKQEKIHMAIVVDEYGGSAGIVTMEDLLEEVTGDIRDEFDEESDIRYRKLDENNYIFEGQTFLNDVCRVTGLPPGAFDTARNNADTLAGLALELKGDIPKTGAEIAWNGYLLTVIAANNRRIEQLKLTLPA